VAMLVNYNTVLAAPVALFFAALNVGSIQLPIVLRLDSSLAGVLQGSLVLFVILAQGAKARILGAAGPEATGPLAAPGAAASTSPGSEPGAAAAPLGAAAAQPGAAAEQLGAAAEQLGAAAAQPGAAEEQLGAAAAPLGAPSGAAPTPAGAGSQSGKGGGAT
jgi:hypothetical protein